MRVDYGKMWLECLGDQIIFSLLHLKKMSISPALWEAKAGRFTRSGVRDQPGQHGETLSLLKTQKKISWVWWHMPVIPATWEVVAG